MKLENKPPHFQLPGRFAAATAMSAALLGVAGPAAQAQQQMTAEQARAVVEIADRYDKALASYRLEPLPGSVAATHIAEYEPPLSNERCIVVYQDDPASPALMHCAELPDAGSQSPAPLSTQDTQEPLTAYWLQEPNGRRFAVVEFRPRTLPDTKCRVLYREFQGRAQPSAIECAPLVRYTQPATPAP
jgi:hypothetical protein